MLGKSKIFRGIQPQQEIGVSDSQWENKRERVS
jgi:hypothetical protein